MRNVPSFFRTNNTGAPQGDVVGLISPSDNSSFSCFCNSSSSKGLILKGGLFTGRASPVLITCSTTRTGGNPGGRSLQNTS
ncbi:hypothetical protein G6F37_014251 [Rhizopus arrhizus]|nr:hypothetical protein G6F38_014143 [Rhizopus arrhizus]KAG1123534.1 hypothetical protein G6F37_014251 [Rhizopus arrhizus]